MAEPAGSRRNFAEWIRLLGFQRHEPPDHQLVTLVGDERLLREHRHGAEANGGGVATDSALGFPRVTVQAGAAGCWVDFVANADSGTPEKVHVYFDDAVNFLAGGILAAKWQPTLVQANPAVPTKSQLWVDAAQSVALAGLGVDPVASNVDAFTVLIALPTAGGGRISLPWSWWVEPQRLLVFLYQGSELTFGVRIREPAGAL